MGIFRKLAGRVHPLGVLCHVTLSIFSFATSVCLDVVFVLASRRYLCCMDYILLFVLLLCVYCFSLSSGGEQFLFVRAEATGLGGGIDLAQQLVNLVRSRRRLIWLNWFSVFVGIVVIQIVCVFLAFW